MAGFSFLFSEFVIITFDSRYVPIKDLHNIFIEYYGDDRGITQSLISSCTLMLLAGRVAEQELGAILYPLEAIRAPIFLDVLEVSLDSFCLSEANLGSGNTIFRITFLAASTIWQLGLRSSGTRA